MFGPAYGHNMKPFIEYFQVNNQYKVTYAYSGRNDFEKFFPGVKFVSYSKNPLTLFRLAVKIRKDYDLIWNQGAYSIFLMLIIYIFSPKKAIKSTNIWGEKIPRLAIQSSFKGKLCRFFLNKSTIVHCNWYGTRNILKNIIENKKLVVFPPGMHDSIFQPEEEVKSSVTESFIANLSNDKVKFFYPKSFTEASDHDCVVEASKILKDKGVDNFCVYFWGGNVSGGNFENDLRNKIEKYNLHDFVKLEKHEFLPFSDFKLIWKAMDCGLQISITDQLSFTLLEPMASSKDLIATDIEPYRIFQDKFPELELSLIERSPKSLAKRMESFILGGRVSENVLKNRKRIVEQEFNFENNINKMLNFYRELKN